MNDISNKIKYLIKDGTVKYNIGDEVIVYRRKRNGYPKFLKDNVVYIIADILPDGRLRLSDGNFYLKHKVHKKYVINKSLLRDIKLDYILNK